MPHAGVQKHVGDELPNGESLNNLRRYQSEVVKECSEAGRSQKEGSQENAAITDK
jgi:hypothetical protein